MTTALVNFDVNIDLAIGKFSDGSIKPETYVLGFNENGIGLAGLWQIRRQDLGRRQGENSGDRRRDQSREDARSSQIPLRVGTKLIPFLEARGLTKAYGQLRANDDVSFSILPGEIVGIVGENGAGKSTLVKMLGGAIAPDSGGIYTSPANESRCARRRMPNRLAFRSFTSTSSWSNSLTVEENLVLGRPELRHGILDFKELRPGFEGVAKDLGTQLQYDARVSTLSVGGRQQVELVSALFHEPRLLILDEPTAVFRRPSANGC